MASGAADNPIPARVARTLLRLSHALHALPPTDGEARRLRLLRGLSDLVGATGAAVRIEAAVPGSVAHAVSSSVGNADAGPALPTPAHTIRSRLRLPSGTGTATIELRRSAQPGERGDAGGARRQRPFTPRQRQLVHLFHREVAWIYAPPPPAAAERAARLAALTPRQRQVLEHLLGGYGEKEVARLLYVSRNTIHHHVKAVYRAFDVNSRGELMARWLRT